MKKTLPLFFFSILTVLFSSHSFAAPQSGMMLSNSCAACHGTKGKSVSSIPGLNQLSAEEITIEMKAFKSGERKATVMGRIAKGFSDKQIKAMSEYLGAKK